MDQDFLDRQYMKTDEGGRKFTNAVAVAVVNNYLDPARASAALYLKKHLSIVNYRTAIMSLL